MIKNKLIERYENLKPREKILFFIATIMLVFFIGLKWLAEGLEVENSLLKREIEIKKESKEMAQLLKQKELQILSEINAIKDLEHYKISKKEYILNAFKNLSVEFFEQNEDGFLLNVSGSFEQIWEGLNMLENNKFLNIKELVLDEDLSLRIFVENLILGFENE